jgi:pimeloyl-ACP methyl ester carboxylesterase
MSSAFYTHCLVGLLLLSAPLAAELDYGQTVPPDAVAGDLILNPCQVYHPGDDKEYPGDCGTLIVPENPHSSSSRLIALPVSRIRATGDAPLEPIFWLEGGPGHANEAIYPSDGLLERHDFVVVGYRGAEGQVVLQCPEIGEAIGSLTEGILSAGTQVALGRAAGDCGRRLTASGVDLDGYSMNQVIEDVEAARVGLGYERIHLFGNSYGTRLQMIYQWRYPDNLHRVLMVAVNPPGRFVWEPEDNEALLKRYSDLCAADAYCSARTPDLLATIRQVWDNMPEQWMGLSVDSAMVRLITSVTLFESNQSLEEPFPMIAPAGVDMWLDAAEGDASGMALVSQLGPLMLSSLFTWGHFLAMGSSAQDYIDPSRDYQTELSAPGALVGAPFSQFLLGPISGWPASSDQSPSQVQDSDIETLLVSGALDGSTPMRYARDEVLPHLTNGHHVVVQGQGHTESFWYSQPKARVRLLNAFFDTGEIDESLFENQPVLFDVETSFGGLARTLLFAVGGIAALTAILVAVVIRLFLNRP